MAVKRILILGGYGNFGKRIAKNLSSIKDIVIIIAGRNALKSQALLQELTDTGALCSFEAIALDINKTGFTGTLKSLKPDLVIHTSGPFQGQDYKVPRACIAAGCHYIDLADDRRFVCDIRDLNQEALNNNVLIVSGASSVPGLSSTVIDHFSGQFSSLTEIDFAIAPGNQAERGEATVKGILSYTGHAFTSTHNGLEINKYGWMSPKKVDFGEPIGKRWLANVDIPDLELFPQRYPSVKTVGFQAGLELTFLHFGLVFMAQLAKWGIVKNWARYAPFIFKSSEIFKNLGSDMGGMQINLRGLDKDNKTKHIKWTLFADNGVGPYIPTLSAIILAKKLINGDCSTRGASPCLGMFTLQEFDLEACQHGIHHQLEMNVG